MIYAAPCVQGSAVALPSTCLTLFDALGDPAGRQNGAQYAFHGRQGALQEAMVPLGPPGISQEAWKVARAAGCLLLLPKLEQGLQMALNTL